MRKLVESTFVSLDGVMSNPQDWAPPYWDDEYTAYERRVMEPVDDLLLGRATYDGFSVSWSQRSGDWYADRMNSLPKQVISRGRPELTWNSRLLEGGDLVASVRALKEQDGGDLLKFGTGETDLTLLPAGLVDELHIWVFPVIAGEGGRLLEGLPTTHLALRETTRFSSGVVVLRFAGTVER
jgi:dihydrofolate reductase